MDLRLLDIGEGPSGPEVLLVGDWAIAREAPSLELKPSAAFFFNLEGPLREARYPDGPVRKVGPRIWNAGLPQLDVPTFANLANNHMMDFGVDVAKETQKRLATEGFMHGGLSPSLDQFPKPTSFEILGKRWAVLAVADPQFGTADANSFGVTPVCPALYESIREAASSHDVVCLSIHAGQENLTIPSPGRRDLYRSFVDAGAQIVWGHHSHVAQVWEQYRQGVIFYGLGNFAVDPHNWSEDKRFLWSLGIRVSVGPLRITVKPTVFQISSSTSLLVEESPRDLARKTLEPLQKLTALLSDAKRHEAIWRALATELFARHIAPAMGWGPKIQKRFVFWLANVLSGIGLHAPRNYRAMHRFHLISNAAHREVIETALAASAGLLNGQLDGEDELLVTEIIVNGG